MKRYNAFYQIHKALRTMLYETAINPSKPILLIRKKEMKPLAGFKKL